LEKNRLRSVDVIRSARIYSGNISVRIDKFALNGKIVEKEIVEHRPSVGMIPIDGNSYVYLVKQYRHATGKSLLEIPAGKIEKGESPEKAAYRELTEEIGYIGKFSLLSTFYLAPGYDTELMYLFLCTDIIKVPRGRLDDDENISIKKMKFRTAIRKCLSGEIQDCKTVAGLLIYSADSRSGAENWLKPKTKKKANRSTFT
jgi:ADP-ribose pyrophosphatase